MSEEQGELSGYKARSFWLMVFATAIPVARSFGFDPSTIGLDDTALTNLIFIVGPALLAVWAYVERLYGKMRLRFRPKRTRKAVAK